MQKIVQIETASSVSMRFNEFNSSFIKLITLFVSVASKLLNVTVCFYGNTILLVSRLANAWKARVTQALKERESICDSDFPFYWLVSFAIPPAAFTPIVNIQQFFLFSVTFAGLHRVICFKDCGGGAVMGMMWRRGEAS